jgi:segregation and condensation protein B
MNQKSGIIENLFFRFIFFVDNFPVVVYSGIIMRVILRHAYYSMSDSNLSEKINLTACLEALLFVAASPISVGQLSEALNLPAKEVEQGLAQLEMDYRQHRGLRIMRYQGRYQLTTAPELAHWVELFLGLEATARLSRAALETLAIIAYRQPITRPGIDAIRGVNSDGVLKSLLSKGLIEEGGRAEGPGRPILYGTTTEFLQHFGLEGLDHLPPFELTDQENYSPEEQRLLKD